MGYRFFKNSNHSHCLESILVIIETLIPTYLYPNYSIDCYRTYFASKI